MRVFKVKEAFAVLLRNFSANRDIFFNFSSSFTMTGKAVIGPLVLSLRFTDYKIT